MVNKEEKLYPVIIMRLSDDDFVNTIIKESINSYNYLTNQDRVNKYINRNNLEQIRFSFTDEFTIKEINLRYNTSEIIYNYNTISKFASIKRIEKFFEFTKLSKTKIVMSGEAIELPLYSGKMASTLKDDTLKELDIKLGLMESFYYHTNVDFNYFENSFYKGETNIVAKTWDGKFRNFKIGEVKPVVKTNAVGYLIIK